MNPHREIGGDFLSKSPFYRTQDVIYCIQEVRIMLNEILEQEFLLRKNKPIEYIGIYELDWLMDDNQLDCEGIIVSFTDKQYLIKSLSIGEDDYDFFYYEFYQSYDCRKILSSNDEQIYFVRKEEEEDSFRVLRFQIGNRPILATADDEGLLTIGISHWDVNDEWLDFENNHLLNDR